MIELVVTHLSVTYQVYHNVCLELLTILSRNFENVGDVRHALGVDVENGSIHGLCDIGAVIARALSVWGGCETDLIIDDDVDSAANLVISQRLHLHALENNALA